MKEPTGPVVSDELLEDCLQAVHRILAQGRVAAVSEIADFARVTAAEAGAALDALRTRRLVGPDHPGRILLTPEGEKQAAAILRRHRLSERLLTDVLGVPWDRAHDEAMRLEHSISPEGEARLDLLLNHPDTCPHGGPIPPEGERPEPPPTRTLDRVPAGSRVRIVQIAEEESEFLRYLASLGLLPRADVMVEDVAPFGGPLLIRAGEARYAIGREVAAKILVDGDGPARTGPLRARRRRRLGR